LFQFAIHAAKLKSCSTSSDAAIANTIALRDFMKLLPNLIVLGAVLLVPMVTYADTATLVSSRDTTIYQMHPSDSDGAGQDMFVGDTGEPSACRGLIGFDIAGSIPAGSTITNVQLSLVLSRAGSSDFMPRLIELHRALADWGEGTAGQGSNGSGAGNGFPTPTDGTAATWSHRFFNTVPWTNAGGDFAATASAGAMVGITPTTYVWNSTPDLVKDVQSWLDGPASNFGWVMLGDESTSGSVRRFFTREASDDATRPSLVVTFTPPSTTTASQLLVMAPANVTAGSAFDITVTALDTNGNIAPNYAATVTFAGTDTFPGMLPATYTFTPADQGTHTFSGGVILFTAGSQTVSAQDSAAGSITGTATVAVTAAPANHLLITAPVTALVGTAFDVIVTALDPYGNVDMNYAGTVTWTASDADPGVVLPPDYPFQANDGGMHVFSAGVTLITAGGQTLGVTDTVTGIAGTATLTVGPGP
jgi:hypothetical protein